MERASSEPDLASARVWRRGRSYADFRVGDEYEHHWGRTITESDAVWFATQTLAHNPLFVNVVAARAAGHDELVVSPYLVLAVVVGLSVEDLSELSEAFLGLSRVAFETPVHIGDTLYARSSVLDVRASQSRPGLGIVTWRTEGRDQHGRHVVALERSNLFRADGAAD
jgi:itaconyl-CoA hydratase